MTLIASILHNTADADHFYQKAERVRSSINTKLFDQDKGLYTDGETSSHASLHANMFPLAFGLVPIEHQKSVIAFIKSRGMACSVYGAQYLLEALYLGNEDHFALDLRIDAGVPELDQTGHGVREGGTGPASVTGPANEGNTLDGNEDGIQLEDITGGTHVDMLGHK